MDRRGWITVAVATVWVALLGVTSALSEPGCRSRLLSWVLWATIPMTPILAGLATWAVRRSWPIVLVTALISVGVFHFLAFTLIAASYGCFE